MMQTTLKTFIALAFAAALAAGACSKSEKGATTDQAADAAAKPAAGDAATAAVAGDGGAAAAADTADGGLPTAQDFEEEASSEITDKNLEAELKKIEGDLGTEE
jgi:hypothetical protein